jgi:hypothetical protein
MFHVGTTPVLMMNESLSGLTSTPLVAARDLFPVQLWMSTVSDGSVGS